MEMRKILEEMEANLENQRGVVLLYESRVKILQDNFDKAKKELDDEIALMTVAKDDVYALEQAIDMLKMGSFAQKSTTAETAKAETAKTAKTKRATKEALDKKETKNEEASVSDHKGAYVLKMNGYDNVLDRWPTQKAAARNLNWDQSSVCKFMKLSKETQLKRKGFYLAWEF